MELTAEARAQLVSLVQETCSPLVRNAVEKQIDALVDGKGDSRIAGAIASAAATPAIAARGSTAEIRSRDVGRIVMAFATARGDLEKACQLSKQYFGEDSVPVREFEKQLSATDGATGGFLLQEEIATDLIELLRPASIVRQLNPVIAPMDTGKLTLPKITGGITASYIGENANAPKTQMAFGQVIATARKLAALVPVSNDLIRRRGAGTDAMVRDDLVNGIAQKSDVSFIRADGTGGEPKGILNWALAANIFNSSATINVTNTVTELGKLIEALAGGNVAMLRPAWMFSWRTWRFLFTLLDANNNFVFKDELQLGTLFGFPFKTSSQIPDNLGGGSDESEIYFVDFSDVVIAEATQIMLDVSTEAAYHDGSNVVAAFSLDQTVIRAIIEHDLVMRHDEAIAILDTVLWGT